MLTDKVDRETIMNSVDVTQYGAYARTFSKAFTEAALIGIRSDWLT